MESPSGGKDSGGNSPPDLCSSPYRVYGVIVFSGMKPKKTLQQVKRPKKIEKKMFDIFLMFTDLFLCFCCYCFKRARLL